jgi:hypothetical protein
MAVSRTGYGRRRFVQLMGWAGVVAMARGGPALAAAATRTRLKNGPRPAFPAPAADTSASARPPEISEEARALGEVVKRRYGSHLTPDDLQGITRDLDGDVRAMKRMGEVKLANADEPDLTFHA